MSDAAGDRGTVSMTPGQTPSGQPPSGQRIPDDAGGAAVPAPEWTKGVYELKFLIDEEQARQVIAWGRDHLQPDPHADPTLQDGYYVNTLYLDTPSFDIYRRSEGMRRQKYRLRRYGREETIWVEVKRKQREVVTKQRTALAERACRAWLDGEAMPPDWAGRWYETPLRELALKPACQVTYRRFARWGETPEGNVRLTMDDRLQATAAEGWTVPCENLTTPCLLGGRRVLELKFQDALPGIYKQLIADVGLEPASFSKYRNCIAASVETKWLFGEEAGT